MADKKRLRISFNAPVTLSFVLICVAVHCLSLATLGGSNRLLFSVYNASFVDPLAYVRCIGHVFGHADWNHLMGNMMLLLILGPLLEEKYGSANLLCVMLATALATGLTTWLFCPHTVLLGASGIVFAFIMLSSITTTEENTIPVSFILVAILYLGQQICQGLFVADNVSQLTHIIGGIVGTILGFTLNKMKINRNKRGGYV